MLIQSLFLLSDDVRLFVGNLCTHRCQVTLAPAVQKIPVAVAAPPAYRFWIVVSKFVSTKANDDLNQQFPCSTVETSSDPLSYITISSHYGLGTVIPKADLSLVILPKLASFSILKL